MQSHYDLIVIGAGGGGYPAALRLAQSGRQVLMVDEKGNLGGNCLYEGCVPSKSVREATVLWNQVARAGFFGLDAQRVQADWAKIRAYKDGVQTRRYQQHTQEIAKTPNLTVIRGQASFTDPYQVQVDDWDHHDQFVASATDIIIATGSEAQRLSIPGFDLTWNHHDLFAWNDTQPTLPSDMVILGGGYIGVESASMLADLGVNVTIIEMAPTILQGMDEDLVQAIRGHVGQRVKIVTGVMVEAVAENNGQYVVSGHKVQDAQPIQFRTSRVMAAVGRVPSIPSSLHLEKTGVYYDRHGITVDERMRTNVPHLYASGDVNGLSMLFHSAVRMSEIVAQDIMLGEDMHDSFNPHEMPTTVFSRPEGLAVGLTRTQAAQRGMAVEEYTRAMGTEAWAQIAGELDGFMKFVVSRSTGRIVGIHGVGVDASALSAAAHMAVRLGLTPAELGHMTFPHPTQFEILDRLARSI
ncbi:MAG: dihydrolipoyl dehydrogenase [Sulfobacillus thermotolerans]|nr:dihydrolipoyl dehydrogenase [Sulfobacillus thermotolerans]